MLRGRQNRLGRMSDRWDAPVGVAVVLVQVAASGRGGEPITPRGRRRLDSRTAAIRWAVPWRP